MTERRAAHGAGTPAEATRLSELNQMRPTATLVEFVTAGGLLALTPAEMFPKEGAA